MDFHKETTKVVEIGCVYIEEADRQRN